MSSNKEMSAIDAVYKILDKLEFLEKKINVLDSNIKIINNKVSRNNPSAISSAKAPVPRSSVDNDIDIDRLVIGNIKTYGYIVNSSRVPIPNVKVEIYDGESIIKSISTDEDGHWSARLPAGQYQVVYSHANFEKITKAVVLNDGLEKYEVR